MTFSNLLSGTGIWGVLLTLALLGTASSTVFLILVFVAARKFLKLGKQPPFAATSLPPVTIFKPVHGLEPRLAQNLESFFELDYPDFEIVIGARDEENPAARVAEEVRRRYPHVKSRIILSGPPTWPNAKVFSLDKMISTSASDYFVISDSDVRVDRGFLRSVIPPLLDTKVGLVTCPYRGIPAADFWSGLEALGMSVELPSGVLVANMMEGMRFAMGAVMATRRDALSKIGGIAATADYYSDDFVLGNEVWAAGYSVVLSHHIVNHVLVPRTFFQTFSDQLRWMKSTRYSRPKGHIGTGLTFATPFGLLGLVSAIALGNLPLGIALAGTAFLNRAIQALVVGWKVIGDRRALRYCWLYPLRDFFGFFIWLGSYSSRKFFWRGEQYRFGAGGKIIPQQRPAESAMAERW